MSRLTICPNPTPGEAKLFFPESGEQKWRTIDLYNMQGARLSVTPLWYEDYATIDLSGQPAGIYIIIVSTDTTCNASRIVKF
jgi:hypothetical protein